MIRWAFLFVFCVASAFLVLENDTVFGQESERPYLLADLSYEVYPTFSRIIIASDKKIDYVSYELQDPYRVVIDLIGVSFCELEERVDFDQGLVSSVDVIETPYVQRPEGIDEFFYAADYIIITPQSKTPYTVSTAEGGKILVVDIGREQLPQIKVSKVRPLVEPSEEALPKEEELEAPQELFGSPEPKELASLAAAEELPAITEKPAAIEETILDYLSYEVLDDASLVIIASSQEVDFKVSKRHTPRFGIVLKPKKVIFTEIEQEIRLKRGLVRSMHIIRDRTIKTPPTLDEDFYPIRYIVIEPIDKLPFDFYSSEDSAVSIVEVFPPKPEKVIKAPRKEPKPEKVIKAPRKELKVEEVIVEEPELEEVVPEEYEAEEIIVEEPEPEPEVEEAIVEEPEPEPEPEVEPEVEEAIVEEPEPEVEEVIIEEAVEEQEEERPITRKEILKELKESLKREELLRKEKVSKEKFIDHEKAIREASQIAERFSREAIKDLITEGEGILGLKQAQAVSIENSPAAKTVKEEVALARIKVREAFRALFPQVKVRGSHTTGDVLEVDFIEEVYGVQGEQPIYQGGRLYNTYKQAKVDLRLTQIRLQKIETDLDLKVAEAYYSTVTAVLNVKLQQELLKETERILKLAEERHRIELSTKLEILNVMSQYNQIQFQLASAERDLALSRFKLQQAMNLDISEDKIDLDQLDTSLQFKAMDVDLDKCLELAFNNQPDILVNKLLVESKRYGEKIARGKDNFKVDLTGFIGKSGSHYETESRELEKDWNIGVKVSKPFWGNTASYAFSKEETSRKVGQTDRTGSTVNSGEFSILDGMSIASDIREARINRQKAANELIDTRRSIALEVKEAYYSYLEAVIQAKNSLEKLKFQEEGVKVARAQSELNEALQSQLLEATVKLTDERAIHIKALSDYNLSLSKLNKAVGIKDYFKIE